jgi:hypothetical protein
MVYTGNGSVECAVKKCPGTNFKFIFSVNFWSILEAVTLDKRPHTVLQMNIVYPTQIFIPDNMYITFLSAHCY